MASLHGSVGKESACDAGETGDVGQSTCILPYLEKPSLSDICLKIYQKYMENFIHKVQGFTCV